MCKNKRSADLICACVATHHIYGSPSMIVDMGTATKIMVVNKKGAFIGVSIIPGAIMGLNALPKGQLSFQRSALKHRRRS